MRTFLRLAFASIFLAASLSAEAKDELLPISELYWDQFDLGLYEVQIIREELKGLNKEEIWYGDYGAAC